MYACIPLPDEIQSYRKKVQPQLVHVRVFVCVHADLGWRRVPAAALGACRVQGNRLTWTTIYGGLGYTSGIHWESVGQRASSYAAWLA